MYDKTPTEISVSPNEDQDNPLAAAAEAWIADHPQLRGWDLAPRWSDDQRDEILLTVPAWSIDEQPDCRHDVEQHLMDKG